MGNLYIIATPIGNLQDITLRAIEKLKSTEIILCEDTRKTGNLIKILLKERREKIYISYFEQNEEKRIPEIINLLKNGKDVALVSDAGTPTISDPGFKLVRECIKNNIQVISIPGPTSLISALVSSGLPTDKFSFLGFLPEKKGNRLKLLNNLKESLKLLNTTIIIFVSPYKITRTLEDMYSVFGNIPVLLARELTKIHETIESKNISNHLEVLKKSRIKGEITLLFNLKNH